MKNAKHAINMENNDLDVRKGKRWKTSKITN